MFSKLLVPVDGSENSFRALEAAIFLSRKIEAHITALHVMEKPPTLHSSTKRVGNLTEEL